MRQTTSPSTGNPYSYTRTLTDLETMEAIVLPAARLNVAVVHDGDAPIEPPTATVYLPTNGQVGDRVIVKRAGNTTVNIHASVGWSLDGVAPDVNLNDDSGGDAMELVCTSTPVFSPEVVEGVWSIVSVFNYSLTGGGGGGGSSAGYGGYYLAGTDSEQDIDHAEDWIGVGAGWGDIPPLELTTGANQSIGVPSGQAWRFDYSLAVRMTYGEFGSGDLTADVYFALVKVDNTGTPVDGSVIEGTLRRMPRDAGVGSPTGDLSQNLHTISGSGIVRNFEAVPVYYRLMAKLSPDGQTHQPYVSPEASVIAERLL